jgi:Lon protease-like protein
MTLDNATLFPQSLLPLYIFEPRYREMLADALQTERMFTVAMQQTQRVRESPCVVAGLGLIRVSVDHHDGTSHLILQGLMRVQLLEPVQLKPYRIHAICPLSTPPADDSAVNALVTKVHALVRRRFEQGALPFPVPFDAPMPKADCKPKVPVQDVIQYLERLGTADELADLVACALLPDARRRQAILESVELVDRLRKLVRFLMEEIRRDPKNPPA